MRHLHQLNMLSPTTALLVLIDRSTHAQKTKKLFYYIWLVGKMSFLLENSVLATLKLIKQEPVQRGDLMKNALLFFRYLLAITKRFFLQSTQVIKQLVEGNNFKLCLTKQLLKMFKLWCEWGFSLI